MLRVTETARERLRDRADHLPWRLVRDTEDGFRLAPGSWRSGDMNYAHRGRSLLVARGELAASLSGRVLDEGPRGLVLRPRRGPTSHDRTDAPHHGVPLDRAPSLPVSVSDVAR